MRCLAGRVVTSPCLEQGVCRPHPECERRGMPDAAHHKVRECPATGSDRFEPVEPVGPLSKLFATDSLPAMNGLCVPPTAPTRTHDDVTAIWAKVKRTQGQPIGAPQPKASFSELLLVLSTRTTRLSSGRPRGLELAAMQST